ncbi:hypothetical protein [Flavobacterium sp. XS2P39]|uniref:hypothetical protein n=1 Tax=Flavobacterium sp. XS2P39 TaxID=3401725 RepID=UPI003AAC1F9D
MEDNNKISFSLIQIKTEQFALFPENYSEKDKIKLNTNLTFGLNSDDKRFSVTTKFTFEMKKKPFMSIQVSCFFQIDDSAWKSFAKEDKMIFPKNFVAHMAMLTIGTTRGVLHAKTEDTTFNQYVLPTTNVAEIIDEDVVFD